MDVSRMKKLDLTNASLGDNIMYCTECNYQGEPNTASKAMCDCGQRKHIIVVTEELLDINKKTAMKVYTQKEVIVKGQSYTDGTGFRWVEAEEAEKLQKIIASITKDCNDTVNPMAKLRRIEQTLKDHKNEDCTETLTPKE